MIVSFGVSVVNYLDQDRGVDLFLFFDSLDPINNLSVMLGQVFLG